MLTIPALVSAGMFAADSPNVYQCQLSGGVPTFFFPTSAISSLACAIVWMNGYLRLAHNVLGPTYLSPRRMPLSSNIYAAWRTRFTWSLKLLTCDKVADGWDPAIGASYTHATACLSRDLNKLYREQRGAGTLAQCH